MAKARTLIVMAFGAVLVLAAGCGYSDPFGNSYSSDQVSQYCRSLRPGSAAYERNNCANTAPPTP